MGARLALAGPMRHLQLIVPLTLVYFVAGKSGLFFAVVHASASAVWAPTGIALAALLVFGHRVWPAIFLGAFLVNMTTAGSLFTSLGIAAGNTFEGIAGAYAIKRFAGGLAVFDQARNIFKFVGLAGLLATTISATVGVTALALGGYADWSAFDAIWLTWWLGDAAGALIVMPLLVLWYLEPRFSWTGAQWTEAALLLLALAGVGLATFAGPVLSDYPLEFLCLAPLAWVALRFGQREVATAVALLALIATWATVSGLGPFALYAEDQSLLVLQAFMGTLVAMTLPMAALMTEHKRTQAREQTARAEAEAANRTKDEFLAMLSHELRNPLAGIVSATDVLRRAPKQEHVTAQALDIIQRQAAHLTRVMEDLLDVTRVVAGKAVLVRRPLNAAEAVERCVAMLRHAGRLEQHTVELRAQPVWIHADPTRFDQIIANLLMNSLKYTPARGRIRVSTQRQGAEAIVRVEDNGIGIPPELLPRVFNLFVQGERRLARSEGGLGVGLTLVRQLVEQHDGRVEAHSTGPGNGSAFIVRLPCIDAPASAVSTPIQRTAPSTGSRRILIVEDNADAGNSLRLLLEASGHEVQHAPDGHAGAQAAKTMRPDAVLIDIGLPGIDGYELAREIRAHSPQVRLIALTGYGQPGDRERALNAGFDEHLVKPANLDDLQRVLGHGVD